MGDEASGAVPDVAGFIDPLGVYQLSALQDAHRSRRGQRPDIDRQLERGHPSRVRDVKRRGRKRVDGEQQRDWIEGLVVGQREPAALVVRSASMQAWPSWRMRARTWLAERPSRKGSASITTGPGVGARRKCALAAITWACALTVAAARPNIANR